MPKSTVQSAESPIHPNLIDTLQGVALKIADIEKEVAAAIVADNQVRRQGKEFLALEAAANAIYRLIDARQRIGEAAVHGVN